MGDPGVRASKAGIVDRKSVGEGKSVDLGGRRIIKKKKKNKPKRLTDPASAVTYDCGPRTLTHTRWGVYFAGRGYVCVGIDTLHLGFFFFKQKTAYEI